MAFDPGSLAVELVIAVVTLIASTAISREEAQYQRNLDARSNYIRNLYQAVYNRFGLSIQQLNQYSEAMGIRLSNLDETTRGSARLSVASRIARDYIQRYAGMKKKVNQAINIITAEQNKIQEKGEKMATKATKGENVGTTEIATDLVDSSTRVNNTINDFNSNQDGSENKSSTDQIDTELVAKEASKTPEAKTPINRNFKDRPMGTGYNPLSAIGVNH